MNLFSPFRPNRAPEGYRCFDCEKPYPTIFVVKDMIWHEIHANDPKSILLCFHCAEKRLGRQIKLDDLKACGATNEVYLGFFLANRENKQPELANDFLEKF